MKLKEEYFGSTLGIVAGFLIFASAVGQFQTGGSSEGITSGVAVILGALAYKSAKKRRIYVAEPSILRMGFEAVAILLVALSLLLRNDIERFIAEEPVHLLYWLWALIPYFIMILVSRKNDVITHKVDKGASKANIGD